MDKKIGCSRNTEVKMYAGDVFLCIPFSLSQPGVGKKIPAVSQVSKLPEQVQGVLADTGQPPLQRPGIHSDTQFSGHRLSGTKHLSPRPFALP